MHILVTAGPTREPIDPVRFISNRSSGKMGYAIAGVAARRGHKVTLVSGPVALPPPKGVRVLSVLTAADMLQVVRRSLPRARALVMAAAVAVWRPARCSVRKLKKNRSAPVLHLKPNRDILAAVAPGKGRRIFVGFAAETGRLIPEARRKLKAKNLDLIVANDVMRRDAGFDVDTNRVVLMDQGGMTLKLPLMTKLRVAAHILDWIEARAGLPVSGDLLKRRK